MCFLFQVIEIKTNAKLANIDPYAFKGCQSRLESLDLSNNALTSLGFTTQLEFFQKLSHLSLGGNNIGGTLNVSSYSS